MSKDYLFQEIIVKNPVLIGTIGLCPIVAICTSLKAALIMSVITILTLIIAQALSSLVLRHLPQWLRMSLYMLVGMIVVAPSMLIVEKLDPTTMLALGIYLPLLSVNPVIVRQCEREGVNIGLAESLINSLCAGVGYSMVLITVGIVREIFGNGTIWGVEVLPFAPAAGMLMPMGGFIVLAFMAALLRAYFRKIDPAYAEELAVNSRTAIKGHKGLKSLLIETEEDAEIALTKITVDEILASVNADRNSEKSEPAPVIPTVGESVSEKELVYASVDTEFAEETSPVFESKNQEIESTKSTGFFSKFGKNSGKKQEKRVGKTSGAKVTNASVTEPSETPATPAKPKFEFITLELPSAVKKAEEKAAAEKAAAERAAAEQATVEKQKAEKAAAEKRAAEKAAAEKRAAEETLARERASEKVARTEKSAPAFAAPISEEEAKVETSTEKKNHTSNIVYRSQELERLMSMSLDDILNGLPIEPTDGEESEK